MKFLFHYLRQPNKPFLIEKSGDSLSKACNQLYIEVDSPAEASEIKILFQVSSDF